MNGDLTRQDLILAFLGAEAALRGPFGLLAIEPDECTPAVIERALQQRLDQVRSHPDGESREADRLRLELRKAAQQLSDPMVRGALRQHFIIDGAVIPVQEDRPSAGALQGQSRPVTSTGTVRSEGWSEQDRIASRRREPQEDYEHAKLKRRERMAMLMVGTAAAAFIAVFFLLLVLVWPKGGGVPNAGTGGNVAATPAAAAGGSAAGTSATNSPAGPTTAGSVVPGATAGSLSIPAPASATGTTESTQSPTTPAVAVLPSGASDGAGVLSKKQVREFETAPKSAPVESGRLLKELRDAAKLASTDPRAAGAEGERLYDIIRDWWPETEAGATRATVEAVVQLVYAISSANGGSTHAMALIDRIKSDVNRLTARRAASTGPLAANEIPRGAWAVAFLSRLSRERDLPSGIAIASGQSLNELLGMGNPVSATTFEGGAVAALAIMPKLILKSPADRFGIAPSETGAAFAAWTSCLDAVGLTAEAREEMVLDAMEVAMLNESEPPQDLAVYETLTGLALKVKWRAVVVDASKPSVPHSGPRARLMDWFKDVRISESDLDVLTSQIARGSAAEGIDQTMILGVAATKEDRALLRAKYAAAWGLESSERRQQLLEDWRRAANTELSGVTRGDRDPELRLWAAARLARLNEAAQAIWNGELDRVPALLQDQEPQLPEGFGPGAISSGATSGRSGGMSAGASGRGRTVVAAGSWAEQFLSADRSIPLRMERLRELETFPRPLSPVDAQVLVDAACFGAPFQVQFAAQRIVARDANDTAVLAAMLEVMPRTPKTRYVSETIEKVSLVNLPPGHRS